MESWPSTAPARELTRDEIARNLSSLRALMQGQAIDALVVTSADRHLNEYCPREDNHCFDISGFTGSTAMMLVPRDARAKLYVDGRYHVQADQEVDHELIEVVKVSFGTAIGQALLDDLENFRCVGYEGDRVSVDLARKIDEGSRTQIVWNQGEFDAALGKKALEHVKPLSFIPEGLSGRSLPEKLAAVFDTLPDSDGSLLLLTALDDVAWLTDARGYHFEYQSSYAALALVTVSDVWVSVDPQVWESQKDCQIKGLHFVKEDLVEILQQKALSEYKEIIVDPGQATRAVIDSVEAVRPDLSITETSSAVVAVKAKKTPAEIAHMEAANERSARAIAKTIRWVRKRFQQGEDVTEAAYYEAANGFYESEGARDLSFHTIAAVGANSAIIHFSSPSEHVVAKANDLMLLDSGALYEGGYATDITRAFVAGGSLAQPSAEQKRLYTLVLQGLLNGMMAVFPAGTRGSFIDALTRSPLYQHGMDYAHGTGHGVGIHVHEPGVGISPGVTAPILAGHVSSIEPGIYIEGVGGIRHENVVLFEDHPDFEGFLRCRPLNYVGFDEYLVDRNMLNARELAYFDDYMDECRRRGTADFD